MRKRKVFKTLVSCVVLSTFVMLPITVNFSNAITFASERVYNQPLETMTFITSSDIKDEVEKITTSKNDETLKNLKMNVKNNGLKVKVVNFNDDSTISDSVIGETSGLAVNVKDVQKNKALGKHLKAALTKGKIVYIYGGLKPSEYKKLLDLEVMEVKDKNGTAEFGLTSSEMNNKKVISSGDAVDMTTSIVGYSMDGGYFEVDVTSFDEVGNPRANDEEVYIQEILTLESKYVDDQISEQKKQASLITASKASAANEEVSRRYGYIGSAYDSTNRIIGKLTTDYVLYKESSDPYPDVDFATLAPVTQIEHFNGANANKLVSRIQVYGDDQMDEWLPEGDTSVDSLSLTLGYPYAIRVNMIFSNTLKIDDQGHRGSDYAQWVITHGKLHGTVWRGTAGFSVTDKYIIASVTHTGTVNIGPSLQYPVSWSKNFNASYQY